MNFESKNPQSMPTPALRQLVIWAKGRMEQARGQEKTALQKFYKPYFEELKQRDKDEKSEFKT